MRHNKLAMTIVRLWEKVVQRRYKILSGGFLTKDGLWTIIKYNLLNLNYNYIQVFLNVRDSYNWW